MLQNYNPIIRALFASIFTWGVTALGAALVFVLPSKSRTFFDSSLGFAGGVMTAASFWSLLAPAIEISEIRMGNWAFLSVAVGFALGAAFVYFSDKLIPNRFGTELKIIKEISGTMPGQAINDLELQKMVIIDGAVSIEQKMEAANDNKEKEEEIGTKLTKSSPMNSPSTSSELMLSWRRILLLLIAITVHNFPEGLAIGVGFGSIGKTPSATFERAFNLALGIGLQNFPEGLAVSLPLAGFGYSPFRAFLYGQLSGMVEPLAALLGATVVILMDSILPYALSFAAGAMIYVVSDSIIPEACSHGNGKLASTSAIIGFLVMMCLEVGLG